MYVALIWSRIDYGCVDRVVIQAQALGFCLKAVEKSIGVYASGRGRRNATVTLQEAAHG